MGWSHRLRSLAASGFLVALVVALSVVRLVDLSSDRGSDLQAAAAAVASGNGDVNGDAQIDLSDAVYTLTYLFAAGPPPVPIAAACPAPLTVFVARHAEKEAAGADPCLTAAGTARAERLKDMLARQSHLNGVLATSYCRTIKTAEPTATFFALPVVTVAQTGTEADLIEKLKAFPPGSVLLLTGNSFNLQPMVTAMGVAESINLEGDVYDNLWVVHYARDGGTSSLVHLKY